MFGSFLPNLWSSCNQSVRSREPTLLCNQSYRPRASDRTMVDTFQPRSLSCFRNRKRRHDGRDESRKRERPQSLATSHGLERTANISAPSSRRGNFSPQKPLILSGRGLDDLVSQLGGFPLEV